MAELLSNGILELKTDKDGFIVPEKYDISKQEDDSIVIR